MARAKAAEIMPFHCARKTFADTEADHVDILTRNKMSGRNFCSHLKQCLLGNAELGKSSLRLDLGLGEMTPLRLRHVFGLGGANPELHRRVPVRRAATDCDHLAVAELLSKQSSTHDALS